MVPNIEVLRFSNAIFEPLWNNKYISNIQVTSSEVLGVEDRGGVIMNLVAHLKRYGTKSYVTNGCPLAMEAPISLNSEDIRAES